METKFIGNLYGDTISTTLWSEQSESNWHIILGGDMFYHWTIFALDAEERVALSSPAYETGILLLNYSAMVRPLGLEPRTYRV